MKILTIIGARPQFIKHAVVQKKLKKFDIAEVLLHTGQHFDHLMSEIFFQELEITPPQILLEIKENNSLMQLSEMLALMNQKLQNAKFDYVLVYGDTTSTLAGTLFAKEKKIPLIHIEAGLRSRDLMMPEERNRLICDHLSDFLFAPTKKALENLREENIQGKIILSGDVMQDSFLHFLPQAKKPKDIQIPSNFILCTIHRQSNVDCKERLQFLLQGLKAVSKEIPILFPLHPRTKKRLQEFSLSLPHTILVIPPQGYLQTLWLLKHCFCVFTDSGGLQKEAYFAKKKCLILREISEWMELIESGASQLLGDKDVFEAFQSLGDFDAPSNLYGEENSAEKILQSLIY